MGLIKNIVNKVIGSEAKEQLANAAKLDAALKKAEENKHSQQPRKNNTAHSPVESDSLQKVIEALAEEIQKNDKKITAALKAENLGRDNPNTAKTQKTLINKGVQLKNAIDVVRKADYIEHITVEASTKSPLTDISPNKLKLVPPSESSNVATRSTALILTKEEVNEAIGKKGASFLAKPPEEKAAALREARNSDSSNKIPNAKEVSEVVDIKISRSFSRNTQQPSR